MKGGVRDKCVVAFFTSMLVFASVSPGEATPEKRPIKLGFLTSKTGLASPCGNDMLNGLQLALDQCHYQVSGRKIELIVEDDQSSLGTAIEKAQKLIEDDKVDVMEGIVLSQIGYNVVPIAEKNHVPLILSQTGADELTKRQHFKWIVRTGFSASQGPHAFGDWAYKHGYRRIAILELDFPFTWAAAGGFQTTFEQAGGQIVQKIFAPLKATDFTEYLKSIRPDADAVFVAASLIPAAIIEKQYHELGIKLPLLAIGQMYDLSNLENMGDEAIGDLNEDFYTPALQNPANRKFIAEYRAKYHKEPGACAESAYTAGLWLRESLKSVNGNVEDREALLKALKSLHLNDAPRGAMVLDDRANPVQNYYVFRVQRVGGKLQNVPIATFPMVSQFWTFKPEEFLKKPEYDRTYPPCRFCH